ncbi:hypothetical protein AAFN86_02425 [Roseomonas sp. CAU 1739]|uniref:hypothetical protein n=1 Tax=Roseomonas sp. CAU 1739 TaxID=3140364 RepID=UPI00325B7BCA
MAIDPISRWYPGGPGMGRTGRISDEAGFPDGDELEPSSLGGRPLFSVRDRAAPLADGLARVACRRPGAPTTSLFRWQHGNFHDASQQSVTTRHEIVRGAIPLS